MKVPLETRIDRLERQRDVLRGQLPFVGPGPSERRYLTGLLRLVASAIVELRRRQAVQRRCELMEMADFDYDVVSTRQERAS